MTMTLKQFTTKGGYARAASLTPERRKEIAKAASIKGVEARKRIREAKKANLDSKVKTISND